jgi:hypothetical protein
MFKNLLVGTAAALTFTLVSPAEVIARGFGGYHGGGSAGHHSGSREGSYSGDHYNGNHEGSDNGAGRGSYGTGNGYHPHGAPYGAAGVYRAGADAGWGAAAYGGAADDTSGYYSAIPSDEGVTQEVPTQPYVPPTTGAAGGISIVPGVVGGWGGDGGFHGGFRGGVR